MQNSARTTLRMVLFVAWVTAGVIADDDDHSAHVDALQTDLLLDYNKDQAPRPNSTSPLVIQCTFMLTTVLDFNELAMELSVYGYLATTWKEPRMTWDFVEKYGYVSTILLPLTKVWVPPIILGNPSDNVAPLTQNWMSVRYLFDGTAFWGAGENFKTMCKVDVQYYPFDTQRCAIEFFPLNYPPNEIKLNASAENVSPHLFTENGKWELINTNIEVTEYSIGYSVYAVNLHLKRRPEFFIVNILLPVVFMAILNVFVFALPAEAGERVSYCVTVLLSIAVFLTLLGDNIPKTSSPMSLLGYFLITELSFSVFICVATILNLRLFHKSESHAVPSWLRSAVRAVDCMFCKKKRDTTKRSNHNDTQVYPIKQEMAFNPQTPGSALDSSLPPKYASSIAFTHDTHSDPISHGPISDTVDQNRSPDTDGHARPTLLAWSSAESTEDDLVTWQDVSRMVDKLLAVFSVLVIFVCILVFYGVVIKHSD